MIISGIRFSITPPSNPPIRPIPRPTMPGFMEGRKISPATRPNIRQTNLAPSTTVVALAEPKPARCKLREILRRSSSPRGMKAPRMVNIRSAAPFIPAVPLANRLSVRFGLRPSASCRRRAMRDRSIR